MSLGKFPVPIAVILGAARVALVASVIAAGLVLASGAALAAPPPPGPPGGPGGPFGSALAPHSPTLDELYPPDLILENQTALELSESQLQSLKRLLLEVHTATLETEFSLHRAVEGLHMALKAPRVDENAALAAADRVMQLETATKKAHLTLLIRVKNLLTPEQQQKADTLRPRRGPRRED